MGKKNITVLCIHGMGDLTEDDFRSNVSGLEKRLKNGIDSHKNIKFFRIFFSDILMRNTDPLHDEYKRNGQITWGPARKKFFNSFSDASSIEHRPEGTDSTYYKVQERIYKTIKEAYSFYHSGDGSLMIIAHSLGVQVIINYLWDSQFEKSKYGIWSQDRNDQDGIPEDFLRLKNLSCIFSSGCNIPLFVAGKDIIKAPYIDTQGYNYIWENYFDAQDPLGWPLNPLGIKYQDDGKHGISYNHLKIRDYRVNIGLPVINSTFLSHTAYWKDKDYIDPLRDAMKKMLV